MTTPVPDWSTFATQLRDIESVRFAARLVQFQREWLDNQAAQLEQIQRTLAEQEAQLSSQSKSSESA
jgi:cell division protein FtsB